MKAIVVLFILMFMSFPAIYGQIKIGDNPQNIDPASVLELESNSRVLVITKATTDQMNSISPQRGGLVYNTDTDCVHYYNGTQWINLCDTASLTLTNDPVVNNRTTIAITESPQGYNLEVAENSILGANIVDGGIGPDDIQDNSITDDKLGENSVGSSELRQNSVGTIEIIDGSIQLTDLANDIANQVLGTNEFGLPEWQDPSNITQDVQLEIAQNTMDIADHVLNDTDTDETNESLTGIIVDGDELVFTESGNETRVDLSGFNNAGSDNQTLTLIGDDLEISNGNSVDLNPYLDNTDEQELTINGNIISLTNGGSVTIPAGAAEVDGDVRNELQDLSFDPANNILTLTTPGTPGNQADLSSLAGGGSDGAITNVTVNATDLVFNGSGTAFNGSIPLSSLGGGGTADGVITDVELQDTDLIFTGVNGGFNNTISLATLGGGGTADGVISTVALNGTDLIFTGTDGGFNGSIPLASLDNQNAAQVPVTAAATNYNAATADVAAHLAGIDNALANAGQLNLENVLTNGTSAGNSQINDLLDPTLPQDAATQNYVETRIATILGAGGADGVIGNVFLNNNSIEFVGTNGGFTGLIDLSPIYALDTELATAISNSDDADLDKSDINEIQIISSPDASVTVTPVGNNYELSVAGATVVADNITIEGNGVAPNPLQVRDGGITTTQILDGTIATDDIADNNITVAKIAEGLDGQVLTTVGTDVVWAASTSGTVVSTDVPNAITLGTDGGAVYDDTAVNNAITANTTAIATKEDTANKSSDITLADATNTLFPTELAVKTYVDNQISGVTAGNNLSNTDLTQLEEDRTYNLNNQNLVFSGLGRIGIGNGANPPQNKLHVAGEIRSEGFNSSQGTAALPAYTFSTGDDIDTGMYRPAADELGFSVGGFEALRIDEPTAGNNVVIINQNLELDGVLTDITGAVGTSGQVLSSTGVGVSWVDASTGGGGNPTDEIQDLDLTTDILTITNNAGATPINLAPYLDNTDEQDANEVAVTAAPTNYTAGTPDVEAHLVGIDAALAAGGGNPTDEIQDLDLTTDILTITNNAGATPINLAPYLDNTDEQDANEVAVTAVPTNYTAGTPDVEAHLVGIDAALAAGGAAYSAGVGLTLTGGDTFNVDNLAGDVTGPPTATVIADDAINSAKIADGAISINDMGPNSVDNAQLQDDSVTSNKIVDGEVQTQDISNETIINEDISPVAGIDGSKINPVFISDVSTTGNLQVDGNVNVTGTHSPVPDYVFQKYFLGTSVLNDQYQFKSLSEIEKHITEKHHLPGVQSAAEIKAQGFWNLGEASRINLEKIEELFLHTIEQEKKIQVLSSENEQMAKQLESLQKQMEEIKNLLNKKSKE